MTAEAMLSAREVTAGYGAVPVIRDVSVDAVPGEVALVIGPNGAGKSTLIKAIIGELPLMSGRSCSPARTSPGSVRTSGPPAGSGTCRSLGTCSAR